MFIFCPSDIREYVEENVEGKEIWWKEPAIVVKSQGSFLINIFFREFLSSLFSKLSIVLLGETTVTASHVSGDRFPVGSTEVVYSANDQTTLLTSECRFSVEIVQPGSPIQPSPP